MSIERCDQHDRNYDTDFHECCPNCEHADDWDADVAAFEATLGPLTVDLSSTWDIRGDVAEVLS